MAACRSEHRRDARGLAVLETPGGAAAMQLGRRGRLQRAGWPRTPVNQGGRKACYVDPTFRIKAMHDF
jgi:hypothetical protein